MLHGAYGTIPPPPKKDKSVNYKKANYFSLTRNEIRFMEYEDFTEVMSNDRLASFLSGSKYHRSAHPTDKHLLFIDSTSGVHFSSHSAVAAAE